jgi:hypothetical protein
LNGFVVYEFFLSNKRCEKILKCEYLEFKKEKKMNDSEELIVKYFNSLNETDGAVRRRLIEEVWAENGEFASPIERSAVTRQLTLKCRDFKKQFPGTKVRRSSKIDVLDDKYVRFNFEAAQADGAAFIEGVDFGIITDGSFNSSSAFLILRRIHQINKPEKEL